MSNFYLDIFSPLIGNLLDTNWITYVILPQPQEKECITLTEYESVMGGGW